LVPAYGIWDLNFSCKVSKVITLKGSLNNATDKHYFTKRPLFYPGVGIWPSDGRNGVISLIVKI
jgi:Fe(3+) dicitrate transport protein